MKTRSIIGFIWITFSGLFLLQAMLLIYQYSTPGVSWLYMTPSVVAYQKIVLGTYCFLIGYRLIRLITDTRFITFALGAFTLLYIIWNTINFGVEMIYHSWDIILIIPLIIVTARLYHVTGIRELRMNWERNKGVIIMTVIVGCSPGILDRIAGYHLFEFLHS